MTGSRASPWMAVTDRERLRVNTNAAAVPMAVAMNADVSAMTTLVTNAFRKTLSARITSNQWSDQPWNGHARLDDALKAYRTATSNGANRNRTTSHVVMASHGMRTAPRAIRRAVAGGRSCASRGAERGRCR